MCSGIFLPAKAQYDRDWKVYLIPFSHTDVGYTTTVEGAIQKHEENFDKVMSLIESTKNENEGERFKWTVEISWALKYYLQDRSQTVVDSFMNYVRNGDIEIGALQFSLQSDLCGSEELTRALYFSQELKRKYNIPLKTALTNDTPGFTWAFAQLLSKSKIPYFSVAMNSAFSDFFKTTNLPYLFNWEAQDGTKTLVWRCIDKQWAYLEGAISDQVYASYSSMQNKIDALLKKLQSENYPYDAVYINCATGDNGDVNTAIINNVKTWNQNHGNSKLIIATPSEFFDYVSQKYSAEIPTYKGDAANWWTWFFAPSSSTAFSLARQAHNKLPDAEKFSSLSEILNTGSYPADEINEAYYHSLLYEDHNLGSADGTGDEEFWSKKVGWITSAKDTAEAIINNSIESISKEVKTGNNFSLAVFNSSGKDRNEYIKFPLSELIQNGIKGFNIYDPYTNQNINYQILSDSNIVFNANNIPSFGYKIFKIIPSSDPLQISNQINSNVLENNFYKVSFDENNGDITSVYDKELNKELTKTDGVFNRYSLNGDGSKSLQVIASDSGAVLQRVVLKGSAPGTNWIKMEIILPADNKEIIFKNSFDKPKVTSLQSVDYKFNFNLASPVLHYEIPFGQMEIYKDEMRGFKTNHYAAQKLDEYFFL